MQRSPAEKSEEDLAALQTQLEETERQASELELQIELQAVQRDAELRMMPVLQMKQVEPPAQREESPFMRASSPRRAARERSGLFDEGGPGLAALGPSPAASPNSSVDDLAAAGRVRDDFDMPQPLRPRGRGRA